MKFKSSDTEKLLEIFRWRRDVRHFKTTQLKPEEIQQLKDALAMSPSVGNSRPWRIIDVQSQTYRQQIIESHIEANAKASTKYNDSELDDYKKLKLAGLKEAPLQLAIFTDMDPEIGRGLGRQTMPETLVYSTITAIQQLWLVARTLNIGVGWVSILKPDSINETLKVNPEWKFTAYLCLGYPKYMDDTPELHREGWQLNTDTDWQKI